MVSPSHIYPGPVGVDIKCSMSLLQLNLPADAINERPVRRALIGAICDRTPTGPGMGQRNVPKSRPVDPTLGPISHAISVRGMIGLTAWIGMLDIGRPRPGETALVSAGAGAVGSVAGQLAKLAGARSVAIVGGERKRRHALEVLGYDAAVDHRSAEPLEEALARACPEGIDVYFDNVGGSVLETVLGQLRLGARLAMCGNISGYNLEGEEEKVGLGVLLGRQTTMTWFSINEHLHELEAHVARMAPLVAEGRIVYTEDIAEGFDAVIPSFLGLFSGENLGKRLVRIAELT